MHRVCMCKVEACWSCIRCACANWRLSGHAWGVRMHARDLLALYRACICKVEACWPCTGCAWANWRLSGIAQGVHVQIGGLLAMDWVCHALGVRGQTRGLLALYGVFIMQSEALLALHRAYICKSETFWHCTGCACEKWTLSGLAQAVRMHTRDFGVMHKCVRVEAC